MLQLLLLIIQVLLKLKSNEKCRNKSFPCSSGGAEVLQGAVRIDRASERNNTCAVGICVQQLSQPCKPVLHMLYGHVEQVSSQKATCSCMCIMCVTYVGSLWILSEFTLRKTSLFFLNRGHVLCTPNCVHVDVHLIISGPRGRQASIDSQFWRGTRGCGFGLCVW